MRKLTLSLAALLLIGGSVFAGSYRVHYFDPWKRP